MDLVDTHCHIQSSSADQIKGEEHTQKLWQKAGNPSGDELISAAAEASVTGLICVGCSLEDSQLAVDFVQKHQNCWASIGIHPHEAKHHLSGEILSQFSALAAQPKVVAVGECGLDYYYQHSPKDEQRRVLEFQLELAAAAGLPVIFHVREAFDDFWAVYNQYQVKGVLHSFTDSKDNLNKALAAGLYIGVNGIATFTRDPAQVDVYKAIPLEHLLLETDSPYLSPKPHRGKINQPARARDVAEFLAQLRGESLSDIATVTTANARKLFGLHHEQ